MIDTEFKLVTIADSLKEVLENLDLRISNQKSTGVISKKVLPMEKVI